MDRTEIEAYVPATITPATQVRGRSNTIVNVVARLKPDVSLRAGPQRDGSHPGAHRQTILQHPQLQPAWNCEWFPCRNGWWERTPGFADPAGCRDFRPPDRLRQYRRAPAGASFQPAPRGSHSSRGRRWTPPHDHAVSDRGTRCSRSPAGPPDCLCSLGHRPADRFGPKAVPRLEGVAIDGRVLAFTVLISLVSGVLFGLGPAISLARANLHGELKEGGKATSGALRVRLRSMLVAGELASALVLLIGAGLMVKSLWRMNARPPGFHPESILVMKISLTGPAYRARPQQIAYFEEALSRLERTPGVVAAGTVFSPMRGVVQLEGAPLSPANLAQRGIYYSTSPGYFSAMGMRLLQGRWMTDNEPSEVMMVNETFVRRILGGASPLGKNIHIVFPQRPPTPQSSAS